MNPQSIIAATPGFSIIEPVIEGEKIVDTIQSPIIGWVLSDGEVYPVNMFNVCKNDMDAILTPTGTVFDSFQTPYDSVQDWITYKNKRILK